MAKKLKDESMTETDLTRAVERLVWVREADLEPKDKSPWPYFSHGNWRLLIGSMGWATCYLKDEHGIDQIESRRVTDVDAVVQLVRSRT